MREDVAQLEAQWQEWYFTDTIAKYLWLSKGHTCVFGCFVTLVITCAGTGMLILDSLPLAVAWYMAAVSTLMLFILRAVHLHSIGEAPDVAFRRDRQMRDVRLRSDLERALPVRPDKRWIAREPLEVGDPIELSAEELVAIRSEQCCICLHPLLDEPSDAIQDDEEGCSCAGEGELVRYYPCGHDFHNGCMMSWLKKSRQCPICRARVQQVCTLIIATIDTDLDKENNSLSV